VLWAVLALSTMAAPAFAEDTCVDAYDGSQRLRREGKLLEAKSQLLQCAQEQCPEAVAKECTRWLREVNESLPTVVFGVRDARGQDVGNARVTSQGKVLAERIDGRAVELDPGQHSVRFELPDGRTIDKTIVVREGEKNRLIELSLPAPPEAAKPAPAPKPKPKPPAETETPPPASIGIPTLAIVLGAVGVVALGSFAYFAIDAKSDVDDMKRKGGCAPSCPQDKVDTAERKALIADISLGVGLAALAGAGFVLVVRPDGTNGGTVSFGARF
jgi:hypothetical protein